MGSKDRIARHRKNIRRNILDAALYLGKQGGWNAVSMRKIANIIEYTAPVIYEYFDNKEHILQELTREGFLLLATRVKQAATTADEPIKQLPAMWKAYWNFAIAEQELYRLMFGIEYTCCNIQETMPEAKLYVSHFQNTIKVILGEEEATPPLIQKYYYTFWSIIHGLISINLIREDVPKNISMDVFTEALDGITKLIMESSKGIKKNLIDIKTIDHPSIHFS